MADRVKYFLLGMLFLVVAGVIAYDRWNPPSSDPAALAVAGENRANQGEVRTDPPHSVPEPEPLPELPLPEPIPEPKPEPLPKPAPRPEPPAPLAKKRVHVVKSGESLDKISRMYYGTSRGIAWIAQANSITDVNRIRPNQKLVIPARATGSSRQVRTTRTANKVPATYTVKAGDGSIYDICRRFYGSSGLAARVSRVMEKNNLFHRNVPVGTRLTLLPK